MFALITQTKNALDQKEFGKMDKYSNFLMKTGSENIQNVCTKK